MRVQNLPKFPQHCLSRVCLNSKPVIFLLCHDSSPLPSNFIFLTISFATVKVNENITLSVEELRHSPSLYHTSSNYKALNIVEEQLRLVNRNPVSCPSLGTRQPDKHVFCTLMSLSQALIFSSIRRGHWTPSKSLFKVSVSDKFFLLMLFTYFPNAHPKKCTHVHTYGLYVMVLAISSVYKSFFPLKT